MLDNKSQEVDLGYMELAILGLNEKFVLQEPLQEQADMLSVFQKTARKKQNVIYVHKEESVQHVPQDVINHGLKHWRSIG